MILNVYTTPKKRRPSYLKILGWLIIVAVILSGYSYYALERPLPDLQPAVSSLKLQTGTGLSQLTWPTTGQAAVAVDGTPILEVHGTQTPTPTASVAKVVTALTVLRQKPLKPGEQGPTITLTDTDVAIYNTYVAQEGSIVPVSAGEEITERQMLEAIMLPSANNMADSLAIWAYGSLSAYRAAAQSYVGSLGLKQTTVGTDASGFSPTSTSTAHDLVKLGTVVMDNPVLREIVGMSTATDVPGQPSVENVNFLLGQSGIIGIKTGNTDQAGGVFLSASTTTVNGKTVTVVTALAGAPSLFQALQNSLSLIDSAHANFAEAKLLAQGAVVGEYHQPWGGIIPAAVATTLSDQAWRGTTLTAKVTLNPISPNARKGQTVGTAASSRTAFSTNVQTDVILLTSPTEPSKLWRLTHPF